MTLTARSSLSDVALAVGATLRRYGVSAVLTGGACAAVHSGGQYFSRDVDFVVQGRVRQEVLDEAMGELGFARKMDRYVHPKTAFYVEFPAGPLAVGGDYNIKPVELAAPDGGAALALSPTDACRDRLAAFYHWTDRQSLSVALLIGRRHPVNVAAIRRWSEAEGHREKFEEFLKQLRERAPAERRRRSRRARSRGRG